MGWCDAAPIKLCRQRIHLDHSLADGHSIERTPVVRQFWFEHFREPRFWPTSGLPTMKTAGRENQKRYTSVVASRAHGTEGENNPAQRSGLDGKKNSGHRRSVFSLTSFMELIRTWPSDFVVKYPTSLAF